MINNLFSRLPQHQHTDPAQRALGVAELQPDSADVAHLLTADPAPEVRIAAARRCADARKLAAAWQTETDDAVRAALAEGLVDALDALHDAERRAGVLAAIDDDNLLIELALAAGHAEMRKAAATRITSAAGLRKLADAAKSKDRGVARIAQQRLDSMASRAAQTSEADAILAELTDLATRSGAIVSAVVELDRRWHALDMSGDPARVSSYQAARETVQARFAREQDEQRGRTQFERGLHEWVAKLAPPEAADEITRQRAELAAFRTEAAARDNQPALAQLEAAESSYRRI